ATGVRDPLVFGWFEPPAGPSLDAAEDLLRALGAVDASGALTPVGRRMVRFPVHPRLARMIVEAEDRGVADEACLVAALLGEREIVASRRVGGFGGPGRAPGERASRGPSDVLAAVERFREADARDFAPDAMRALGLDPGATQSVERVRKHLA